MELEHEQVCECRPWKRVFRPIRATHVERDGKLRDHWEGKPVLALVSTHFLQVLALLANLKQKTKISRFTSFHELTQKQTDLSVQHRLDELRVQTQRDALEAV